MLPELIFKQIASIYILTKSQQADNNIKIQCSLL